MNLRRPHKAWMESAPGDLVGGGSMQNGKGQKLHLSRMVRGCADEAQVCSALCK